MTETSADQTVQCMSCHTRSNNVLAVGEGSGCCAATQPSGNGLALTWSQATGLPAPTKARRDIARRRAALTCDECCQFLPDQLVRRRTDVVQDVTITVHDQCAEAILARIADDEALQVCAGCQLPWPACRTEINHEMFNVVVDGETVVMGFGCALAAELAGCTATALPRL